MSFVTASPLSFCWRKTRQKKTVVFNSNKGWHLIEQWIFFWVGLLTLVTAFLLNPFHHKWKPLPYLLGIQYHTCRGYPGILLACLNMLPLLSFLGCCFILLSRIVINWAQSKASNSSNIWVYLPTIRKNTHDMSVSKNRGTPKSSILIGCSIIFTIHFGW